MPTPRKSAAEIMLAGNTAHLSRAQLAERVIKEGSDAPAIHFGRPRMPKTFSALEVECWKSAVKILRTRGTLSRGDGELLEMYAVTKARWVLARRDIEQRGFEVVEVRHSKGGDPYDVHVPNPSLKIASDCEVKLLGFAKALGLTTLDRNKPRRAHGSRPEEKRFVPKKGTAGELSQYFDSRGKLKVINGPN